MKAEQEGEAAGPVQLRTATEPGSGSLGFMKRPTAPWITFANVQPKLATKERVMENKGGSFLSLWAVHTLPQSTKTSAGFGLVRLPILRAKTRKESATWSGRGTKQIGLASAALPEVIISSQARTLRAGVKWRTVSPSNSENGRKTDGGLRDIAKKETD